MLPALGLIWLFNSESGMRWGYLQILPHLPGSIVVTGLSGTLAGPITAQAIRYQDQDQTMDARQVTLNWNPLSLLWSNVDISEFHIHSIDIVFTEVTDTSATDNQPLSLPQFKPPLAVKLKGAVVNSISISSGTYSYRMEQIRANAAIGVNGLVIQSFEMDSEKLQLSLQGRLHPTADYAHDFKLSWRALMPSGAGVGATGLIRGDLRSTSITQSLEGALQMDLSLELRELLSRPSWQAELEVSAIDDNLLDFQLPLNFGRLKLSASGDTEAARVSGILNAESAEFGGIVADFALSSLTGARRFDGIHIDALNIGVLQGQLSASGRFDWSPALRWEADIQASQLNPATLLPQWPGSIEAQVSSSGSINDGELIANANISRMQGELRGYPVALQSQLLWQNDAVEISQLDFNSGNTRLSMQGLLNETLDLRWSLDSDNLAELYPSVQGRLKAKGEVSGSRQSPVLKTFFAGNALQYLNYEVDKIQGELEGEITDNQWHGKLKQAYIQTRDYDNWTLQTPSVISLSANSLLLDNTCLQSDNSGKICNRLEYRDDIWKIGVGVSSLALSMFKRWMPADLKVEGRGNASAVLEYRAQQQLLGNIEIDLPPGSASYKLSGDHIEYVDYRSAKLEIHLQPTGINADIELTLINGDGFKGQIALPGGNLPGFDSKSQSVQANVHLEANKLSLIDLMVEQIDDVQGTVTLDAAISGTLESPLVKGSAQLLDGDLNIPGLRLRLSQINLYLDSADHEKISYRGEAQTGSGKLTMRGDTLLQASKGWLSNLLMEATSLDLSVLLEPWLPDDVRVDGMLSSSARLKFRAPGKLYGEIELSAPSGNLSYPLLEGEMENWEYHDSSLKLVLDQQGIRGHSEISIGDGNTLRGDIHLPDAHLLTLDSSRQALEASARLSITKLAKIEAFIPELDIQQGSLNLNLSADGTLARPALAATMEMLDASATIPRLGLTL
ncbi:MAG: hypothetical protein GY784_09065, partial [Gammaproteobacteria bacterium]|nr:hypothetical protein [Gammaproteobacteria bacterium]